MSVIASLQQLPTPYEGRKKPPISECENSELRDEQ
jgi:hypothetical protein